MNNLKLLFLFFLISCAQVTSLGLKKHEFGKLPTKIIWFQVAGLSEEHLALLKFDHPSNPTTTFEDFMCLGKAWEYNLFELRPQSYYSFMSQMTGKKNIKKDCSDYEQKPIWSYMLPNNYRLGVFEGQTTSQQSVMQSLTCNPNYLHQVAVWRMSPAEQSGAELFHQSEKKPFEPGKIYYDRSCAKNKGCYTNFTNNVTSVFENYYRNSPNYLFIVRNFQFSQLLANGDIKNAREELEQLEKTIQYFQQKLKSENNMLLLVSSAETFDVNYPKAGKEWEQFVKKSQYQLGKNSRMLSPIFASGARAENFCGVYDQSEMLTRIFSGAKQQGLEYTIINPFD